MSILSSDWTCEHLIRTKRPVAHQPEAKKIGVEEGRERDRDLIMPLAKTMTQTEIAKRTGLRKGRVHSMCEYYGIACVINRLHRRKEGGRL